MDFHLSGSVAARRLITPYATACTCPHHSLTTGAAGLQVIYRTSRGKLIVAFPTFDGSQAFPLQGIVILFSALGYYTSSLPNPCFEYSV